MVLFAERLAYELLGDGNRKAGHLTALGAPEAVRVSNGQATVKMTLPRQAVSLLVVEWVAEAD